MPPLLRRSRALTETNSDFIMMALSLSSSCMLLKGRRYDDVGIPDRAEADRYIAACDYRENNEYWQFADEVLEISDPLARGVVIDIGSGPGTMCECLRVSMPGTKVVGIDRCERMIEHARESYPRCTFIEGCAEAIPLRSASVDIVVSLNTLHHLSDVRLALYEMARVLRPGGIVYLGDLRRDASGHAIRDKLSRIHIAVAEDFKRSLRSAFTMREFRDEAVGIGFENISVFRVTEGIAARRFADPYQHEKDALLYYRARMRTRKTN